MLAWIVAHWMLISLAALVLVSILNAITRHYSTHTGLVKVLLLITELLSPLTSREVPSWLKLPLTSVPPEATAKPPFAARVLVPFALLMASTWPACATTPRGYLGKALVIVEAADHVAIPAIQQACAPKVSACPPGPAESCPAFVTCSKALKTYQATATAITRELETLNKLLFDLEVK